MEVPVEHLAELAERIKKLEEMEERIKALHSMLKGKIPKGKNKMLTVSREVNEFLKEHGFKEREALIVKDIKDLPPIEVIKTIAATGLKKDKLVYYTEDDKKFKNLINGYKKAIRSALSRIPAERKNLLKEYYYSILHTFELFNAKFDEEVAKKLVELNAHEVLERVYPGGVLKVRRGEIKKPRELLELFHTRLHP